jgi:hypothetical protein
MSSEDVDVQLVYNTAIGYVISLFIIVLGLYMVVDNTLMLEQIAGYLFGMAGILALKDVIDTSRNNGDTQ